MASQQLSRRENTTNEREIHVQKDKVPKMTNRFEHLAEKERDSGSSTPPHRSIDELQGGENRREHAGKAVGDMGGPGKARETHELGTHFQSLHDVEKERKSHAGSGRTANIAGSKDLEARREREQSGGGGVISGGVHAPSSVGKVSMQAGGERGSEEASRNRPSGGKLEARTRLVSGLEGGEERGRRLDNRESTASEEKVRVTVSRAETEGSTTEQKEGRRERESRDQGRGRETEEEKGVRESYIVIEKALEGKDMAAQEKDAATEKGQKGYFPAKDTISSVAKTAVDYTAPVTEKAKDYTIKTKELAKSAGSTNASYIGEKSGQAKDVTVETGKSAAGKAGKVAVDLKDKATAAGWEAAHYSVEKTVEGTKAAAMQVKRPQRLQPSHWVRLKVWLLKLVKLL